MTLCFTLLVRPLIRQTWIRWIVNLAFAVHPIHCEAVASVVGRAELGAALHTLIALLAYRAHLKARGRRRSSQGTKETTRNTIKEDDDDEEAKEDDKEEERRKKRKRFESLIESTTRAHRNPFENRQSLLSLFIRRVTICCCWSDPLKKIQYRVTSLTSSNNGQKPNRQQHHHHQDDDQQDGDEFERNRWRSNDKKKKKRKSDMLDEMHYNRPMNREGGSCVYLWASLTAAGSAILWKETGMVAIPLCAVMELIQRQFSDASKHCPETPSNRQSSDRNNRQHHLQVKSNHLFD